MITRTIRTDKYDVELDKLLIRRLAQCGCAYGLSTGEEGVTVTVADGEQVRLLAEALTLLLCRDLVYFELAHLADALPLSLGEKQSVLTSTLAGVRELERPGQVRDALMEYLKTERVLNLEGFLRFRMQGSCAQWEQCVERAAAEQLLRREYAELMEALNDYVRTRQPGVRELYVCINPDGSCTLTDDSDARIEYVDCSEDGIISLLVSMAPARLTVYDLSGGNGRQLIDSIKRVFAGRVKVYR